MASTAPSTPKSKPRFLTCPDTELRHSHTTSSQYLSGDLTEGRRAVLNDLKMYLQVPYEQFVSGLFPIPPENHKIAEIRAELKGRMLITKDDTQLSAFVIKPSANKVSSEISIFRQLDLVISYIFKKVPESLFCFAVAPTGTPTSSRCNTSRPDSYIRLKTSHTPNKTHWFDIVIPFEFRKSDRDSYDVRRDYFA